MSYADAGIEVPDASAGAEKLAWRDRILRHAWIGELADTKVWGLVLLRASLAIVFFPAAIGHLGTPAGILAGQGAPGGPLSSIGDMVKSNPDLFVGLVIGVELFLAIAVTIGLLTRVSGFIGLMLNAFFFAAYELTDVNQLYLSWDASLAILWVIVLLTAPGRYLGLAGALARRYPQGFSWWC